MLNKEQLELYNEILSGQNTYVIGSAVGGGGKGYVMKKALKSGAFNSGLVITLNTAIAKENKKDIADSRFDVKTISAFAHDYIIKPYGYKIHKRIDSIIGSESNKLLDKYCSTSKTIDEVFKSEQDRLTVKDTINKMLNGDIPFTFNSYLKVFQMMLSGGTLKIEYDIVFLDEAADSSEVTLDIFEHIKAKKKVMIGEQNQEIFGFLNTVNGMKIISKKYNIDIIELPVSYRATPEIGHRIQNFGYTFLGKDFNFIGVAKEEDRQKYIHEKHLYISRTKAQIIKYAAESAINNRSVITVKKPSDIFNGILFMAIGVKKEYEYEQRHKKNTKYFKLENSFILSKYKEYVESKNKDNFISYILDQDGLISDEYISEAQLIAQIGAIQILNAKTYIEKCIKNTTQDTIEMAVAHSIKGWSRFKVTIAQDMNKFVIAAIAKKIILNEMKSKLKTSSIAEYSIKYLVENDMFNIKDFFSKDSCMKKIDNKIEEQNQEIKLMYVAISRARYILNWEDITKEQIDKKLIKLRQKIKRKRDGRK